MAHHTMSDRSTTDLHLAPSEKSLLKVKSRVIESVKRSNTFNCF